MPKFLYKALDEDGKPVSGSMEATDSESVIAALHDEGYLPVKAWRGHEPHNLSRRKFRIVGRRRISPRDLETFTREMAQLINAGLPLDRCLRIVQEASANEELAHQAGLLSDDLRKGLTFSDALESQGDLFGSFYVNMVRAGEASGSLGSVMRQLVVHQRRQREMLSKVTTALTYPTVLLTVAVMSIALLLIVVIPEFKDVFESAGVALPMSTRIVIGVADWLQAYWMLLLAGGAIFIFGLRRLLRVPRFRMVFDGAILSLPLIGQLLRKIEVARLCRALNTMVANGVTLLMALENAREIVSNMAFVATIDDAIQGLKAGQRLSSNLNNRNVIPAFAANMLSVGEETGNLESMLHDVAEIYEEEVGQTIERLLSLMEPILILVLGLLIGGIILSIFSAILSVNEFA